MRRRVKSWTRWHGGLLVPSQSGSGTVETEGGSEVVGQVGTYADLNLATYPVYSVDMAEADYYLFATGAVGRVDQTFGLSGTGSQSHVSSGWWDGSAYCRIIPPTTDQYERGVTLQNLYRNATLGIQDFAMRHETRWGPFTASAVYSQSSGAKRILVHYRDTLSTGDRQGRPVFFVSRNNTGDGPNATYNRSNTLVVAPAQNTTPSYNDQLYTSDPDEITSPAYANGPQAMYIVDASDDISSWQGKPVFKCGDYWTIEHRLISQSTEEYPRGLIAERWTNRAGVSVERGIAFNYDTAFELVAYLQEVQQFGCGQWNLVPAAGSDVYFDVGGLITVARNFGGWLNPRAGFVTT